MGCSPPGSSVHGIFQARIPEWVAISFSRGFSPPRGRACVSRVSCTGRRSLHCGATWEALLWARCSQVPARPPCKCSSSPSTDGASEAQRCGKGDNRVRLGRGWPEGKPGGSSASAWVLCSVPLSSLRMHPAGACIRAMTSWRSTKRHQVRGKKPRQVASWVLASMRPNALVPAF